MISPYHRLYAIGYSEAASASDFEMDQMIVWVKNSDLPPVQKSSLTHALDNSNSAAARAAARMMCAEISKNTSQAKRTA